MKVVGKQARNTVAYLDGKDSQCVEVLLFFNLV